MSAAAPRGTASIVYLHGFSSSPRSTKAQFLAERLREHGISLRCPDFNEPSFTSLTMTRMLAHLEADLDAASGPSTLIGSSLGGTLALLAAARFTARIDRLVLLAPAVMFARPGHHILPPERIAEWRTKGTLPFFHYGYGADRPLDFAFYEDSLLYDVFAARVIQPALVFQGLRDTLVDPQSVQLFTSDRPNSRLVLLDDDHQLTASLPQIWSDMLSFLALSA